jgi:hypothetical protein
MSALDFDLVQRRSRGARAKALLEDEIFSQTIADLEARFIREWRNCPDPFDQSTQMFHVRLNLLQEIKVGIQAIADDGKMASLELEQPVALLNRANV